MLEYGKHRRERQPNHEKEHAVEARISEYNEAVDGDSLLGTLAEEHYASQKRRGEKHMSSRHVEDKKPGGNDRGAGDARQDAVLDDGDRTVVRQAGGKSLGEMGCDELSIGPP